MAITRRDVANSQIISQLRYRRELKEYEIASNTFYDRDIAAILPVGIDNVQDAIDAILAIGSTFNVVLSAITPAFSVIRMDASNEAEIVTSDTVDLEIQQIVGITLVAGNAGDTVLASRDKTMVDNPLWAFIPGQNVFLDNAGQLTQVAPTTGNYIPLGYAVTATKVWFQRGGQYRPEVNIIEVGVNVTAGNYVNIYNDAGTVKVRPAEATTALTVKKAHGFVLDTVAAGNNVAVYFDGVNTAIAGLTIGQDYVLGSNGGVLAVTAPPAASGDIIQHLGVAISATMMSGNINSNYIIVP